MRATACGFPLVVGTDRVAAAQSLIRAHAEVDVLLSDDGLQHYALGRDIEIEGRPAADPKHRPGGAFLIQMPGYFQAINLPLQEVSFAPVNARYFRFTSLRAIWNSGWTSAAEISVVPAGKESE